MSTRIEWTQSTVNPVVGCRKISEGCKNCYAERMARRLKAMGVPAYRKVVDEHGWTGKVGYQMERMWIPGKDKMIFVNSMGDLFFQRIGDEERDRVFACIAKQPHHIFQILTKRIERAARYFAAKQSQLDHDGTWWFWDGRVHPTEGRKLGVFGESDHWPLRNLWFGATCENQRWADERIPFIRQIPAAVRFVSLEPLLELVCIREHLGITCSYDSPRNDWVNWVIVGAETGPHRRYCETQWVEWIVRQCREEGCPVFVKALHDPPRKGRLPEVIKEINAIAERLECLPDSLRQWPERT